MGEVYFRQGKMVLAEQQHQRRPACRFLSGPKYMP
jgi:hypothetical protein